MKDSLDCSYHKSCSNCQQLSGAVPPRVKSRNTFKSYRLSTVQGKNGETEPLCERWQAVSEKLLAPGHPTVTTAVVYRLFLRNEVYSGRNYAGAPLFPHIPG